MLAEIDRALLEPSDALGNPDSASALLTASVFPALTAYFADHWAIHLTKLNPQPTNALTSEDRTGGLCRGPLSL